MILNYHKQQNLRFEKCKKIWLKVTTCKTTKSEAKNIG